MAFGFGMGFPRNETFAGGPSLNLQFAGSQVLPSALSFSRLSNATYFDQTGVLRPAAFNSIRNNTMVGVGAGTPGTLPTNWGIALAGGLSRQVVGSGVENGVNYIDVRVFGTTSDGSLALNLVPEQTTQIAAVNGQTWVFSVWCKLVAGSLSGITLTRLAFRQNDSGGGLLSYITSGATSNLTVTNEFVRSAYSGTTNNASIASINPQIWFNHAGIGTVLDFTVRVGMPQMELGSVATPVIATSGSAAGAPRFDYNPTTFAPLGLLIEEQRTNSIRNNTMVGAVAGTPGTLPTNWITVGAGLGTLTQQIVGTGTSAGINYIDIRLSGTTSTTSVGYQFDAFTQIAALCGQTWTGSFWVSRVAGANTNINSINIEVRERDSGGVSIGNTTVDFLPTLSTTLVRNAATRTLVSSSTIAVSSDILLAFSSGVAIDITLRIGLPQLENNNISTGVTSATVAAGGTGYTNGDTLTVVGGTGTAATLTVTGVSAGVITTVSVATAGSYSVFPTSPVSVTGGTGTLATFNLVPVTQSGFATSVILTSTAAATRSADNCSTTTLSPWFNATEGTMAIKYRTGADLITTRAAVFDDGGFSNTISIIGSDSGGVGPRLDVFVAGVNQASVPSGNINAANTVFTFSAAYKANDFAASRNGSAASTDTSGTVPTVTTLRIGQQLNSGYLNGWVQSFSYYPRRLSNAELQSITV